MKKVILNPLSMFFIDLVLGIVLVSITSNIVLYDRLRVYDFIIDGIVFYFLFIKKIER